MLFSSWGQYVPWKVSTTISVLKKRRLWEYFHMTQACIKLFSMKIHRRWSLFCLCCCQELEVIPWFNSNLFYPGSMSLYLSWRVRCWNFWHKTGDALEVKTLNISEQWPIVIQMIARNNMAICLYHVFMITFHFCSRY